MSYLISKNPYTQEINWKVALQSDEQVLAIIDQAHQAFGEWKYTSFEYRKELFLKMADDMDDRNEELSRLETIEMWRLLTVAKKWLKWTADLIRRFANNAERILANESFDHDGLIGEYQYDPLGVIYGIAPWNFPFNQLLRAAVPNILAWNTVVYKHASNVPLCHQAIHELFERAWFPVGVYTALFTKSNQSELIMSHDAVRGMNITGWEKAWSIMGGIAGRHLKPSVLELWGNDAFVLLDHVNTKEMARIAMSCRLSNGWQRCNASKRFVILEKHYDEFVQFLAEHMDSQILWDPLDTSTSLPPLSSSELVDEIHGQVHKTIAEWARLVTWWERVAMWNGNFYAATVLADVTPDMTSAREEVFGPVASVIKSSSIEESIHIANENDFGLSAVVFGDDVEQCKQVAHQLEWGMIFINEPAWSKASLPFGWIKKSGYGKENGPEGLRAFVNKKTVVYSVS